MSQHFRPSAFAPFRVRSFRFQWPADLLTSCAFEMETLILGWYVLVETGSVLLLTLYGALLFIGTLVSPLVGVIGDRIGQRNVLCCMRAFYTLLAVTLMAIAFAGALTPLIVFIIAGLMGLVRPSDLGVRGALVADIMPADQLIGAMGISRTTQDAARVMGALAGAGLFAAFGMAQAYVVVAVCYGLGLLLTLGIDSRRAHTHKLEEAAVGMPRPSHWRDLKEGLAHVWSSPPLRAGMYLAVLVNLTAFPLSGSLLPYVAREIYHINQTGLGYLVASFAFGALIGSLSVSMSRGIRPGRAMILSVLAWYVFLLAFAQTETLLAGVVALAFAGFAQSYGMITLAVMLLRIASERFRGRIMGVRMMAIYGMPVGLLVAGVLIDLIGFSTTATAYAAFGLLFTLFIALRWRKELWRADTPANAR